MRINRLHLWTLPLKKVRFKVKDVDIFQDSDRFLITITDPRIECSERTDILVKSVDGFEPIADFSRHGNGSVFSDLNIEEGRLSITFGNTGNQTVRNPKGMTLILLS